MLKQLTRTDENLIPTILRVFLGFVILPHGAQKLLGWFGGYGYEATMGYFQSMGIPYIFGLLAILAEFFGGIALILGVGTRVAALGVGSVMVVAAATTHLKHGFFMNWAGTQGGEGFEYHLLALAISVAVLVLGAGRFSIDRLVAARL